MKLMNTITREHQALLKETLTKTTSIYPFSSQCDRSQDDRSLYPFIIMPRKIPTLLHN